MSTLLECLEREKNTLLSELRSAGSDDAALRAVSPVMDRILYRYNEDCTSAEKAKLAADLIHTCKLCLPLMDCHGDARVWERESGAGSDSASSRKKRIPDKAVLIGGLLCLAGGCFCFTDGQLPAPLSTLIIAFVLTIAGGFLLYLAGKRTLMASSGGKKDYLVEQSPDPEKVYRTLRTAIMTMDQRLQQINAGQPGKSRSAKEAAADEKDEGSDASLSLLSAPSLDLLGDLLEAAYSKDGAYALEQAGRVKYMLNEAGIQTEDYSPDHTAWFDLMPSKNTGTIRPALLFNGKLLKKGLAMSG